MTVCHEMDVAVPLTGTPADGDLLHSADALAFALGARLGSVYACPRLRHDVAEAGIDVLPDDPWKRSTAYIDRLHAAMDFISPPNEAVVLHGGGRELLSRTMAILRRACMIVANVPSLEDAGSFHRELFIRIVMASGRPVLVLPQGAHLAGAPGTILVALGDSPQGTRALNESLPLLRLAHSVYVVNVGNREDTDKPCPRADSRRLLREHLERHGVRAKVYAIEPSGDDIGDTLIYEAGELGAHMVVAGAFGRSTLEEFIFGSTTLTLMQRSTIPLLMAH
jgi:nucleotide-binding universal stress UspA family protein